ncbi:cytochrome P450 [Rhodococcus phenolicus]|uniref:cytochrome P450 n=1 Tax=Rhodococcus phenolicus TaxID=263849 RepID=UPI0009EF2694|nr:cytochrome P450 [Rhodococcus phenolicus]
MGDEAVSTRLDPSHSDTCRIGGATAPLKVPTSDRGVIRTVRDFRSDILKATEQGWRRHGDIVRYRLGPVSVYCISDSELAHEVFVNPLLYGKLGADNPLRLVLGTGLLTASDHEVWKRNRRMMQPLYSRASIEQMYSTMHDCVARMVDRIETHNSAGDTIDMHRVQMEVTLDVVSRCMFSVGIADLGDAADPRSVEHALNFAFDRLQNPLSPPLAWPTPTNKRFRRIMDEFDDVVYRLIADRRASDRNHGDMLDMLIDARDEETGEALDDREIRDEVMTTFAAGHESTAQTLTWAMYLLSKNPDVVDRLRDEVDSVLDGRLPTAADLKNLRYTAGVAAEALRLFPSAPLIPRLVARDCTLGGHRLRAGSRVLVSLYNIGRDRRHWEDPEAFRPDRFEFDKPIGVDHKAYAPFGAGPHICIGKHFAIAESQMILAGLFQRFEFRHDPHHEVRTLASITLRPRYGMDMIYRPRTDRPAGAPRTGRSAS